jgi:hypothetical protein
MDEYNNDHVACADTNQLTYYGHLNEHAYNIDTNHLNQEIKNLSLNI